MSGRRHAARVYDGLKAAAKALCERCGNLESAALHTRVAHQTLWQYGDQAETNSKTFIPADVIADLEDVCGDPVFTRALARLAGFELVRRSDCAPDAGPELDSGGLLGQAAAVGVEAGALTKAALETNRNNLAPTKAQLKRMEKAALAVQERAQGLLDDVRARIQAREG